MTNSRISRLIRLTLALLFAAALTTPAWATSLGTDASDLWGNSGESGWGIQFVHQGDVIFATMYVYDQASNPTWYIATLITTGNSVYSGDLIATHGPWLGAPVFDPAAATSRKVGTMAFTYQFVESGSLTYSVDGVNVTKAIRRTTFRTNNYAGDYLGAYRFTATGCTNAAFNGTHLDAANIVATQGTNSMKITISGGAAGTCVFNGNFSQDGQFGSTSGTYSCNTGENGTYKFFEMAVSWLSVHGRYMASNNFGCSITGTFAGLRDQF